jgi:hypothetical protein
MNTGAKFFASFLIPEYFFDYRNKAQTKANQGTVGGI